MSAADGYFEMNGKTLAVGFQFNTAINGLECVLYDAICENVAMVTDILIKCPSQNLLSR